MIVVPFRYCVTPILPLSHKAAIRFVATVADFVTQTMCGVYEVIST